MEISKILDGLYHGTYPLAPDYDVLADLGIRLIINMQANQGPVVSSPIPNFWIRTNDNPITRIPIYDLARGAVAASQLLDKNERVFVHCRQGRHRSSAMVAAILITRGLTAEDAVKLIKKQRPRSNPRQWYIKERMVRFERLWQQPRAERSQVLLDLGRTSLEAGQLVRAARTVRLAISAHPRNVEAWGVQADIMKQAGRDLDAERFRAGRQWLHGLA
jgi:protein tyrosine phosphatase (PTP) superfamily phosphohydrolase (DUF442 family)